MEHHHEHREPDSHEAKTHNKHEGHSLVIFWRKFWISLILTVPVVVYSDLPERLFKMNAPEFFGSSYIPFILGSFIFFYGGWIFIVGAYRELKARLPGMMTLIALAISVAYIYSVYTTFIGKGNDLFWELTTLITVMLLGHYFEMRAVQGTQSALSELSKLIPDKAEVMKDGQTREISISELKVSDMVLVRPGARIPADGSVVEGKSEVDESLISGESKPVKKVAGSNVVAGAINGDGALEIRVDKIGEETFLSGVMRLVEEAESSKSRLQILSDRAALYLTIIAVSAGVITFVVWLLAKAGVSFAIERSVAVLVIACPHALGLAIPLVASISTTLAARSGFLVRQRMALESARNIDIVLFDKTGTLTKGRFGVDSIILNSGKKGGLGKDEILRLAASVDKDSEHFLARAIVREAKKRRLSLSSVKNFEVLKGRGVKGEVEEKQVFVGGENLLTELKLAISKTLNSKLDLSSQGAKTMIFVIIDNEIGGAIVLTDTIRQESKEAIESLKKMGIKSAMVTGDSEEVAEWVSKELKIDKYFAKVLPQDKASIIKKLQSGKIKNLKFKIKNYYPQMVAMVGDGINDAPALAQADIGIAIGSGTNVAIESAGIILVRNDPRDIARIIRLSRLSYRKMIQNLFWATGYNVVALPLAAGVLVSKGILLQPALSALFMSLSTVIVALNALMLKRQKLD